MSVPERRPAHSRQPFFCALGVYALAVAGPLFALLSADREIWISRGTTTSELVWTVLLISPVGALLVALPIQGLVGRSAALPRALGWGSLGSLGAVAAAGLLGSLPVSLPPWATLLAAAGAGCGLGSRFVRRAVALLAPAVVVLPLHALAQPGARNVYRASGSPAVAHRALAVDHPVVFVVFDALSLPTLMRTDGSVDGHKFPSFERLAASAVWFRDATTVADGTVQAVTAILTGRYPDLDRRRTAIYPDYPDNLLALLRPPDPDRGHEFERHTLLSPRRATRGRLPARVREDLVDAAVLLGHRVLPASARRWLPGVDESWRGFRDDDELEAEDLRALGNPEFRAAIRRSRARRAPSDAEDFAAFLDVLARGPDDALYYFKASLPHRPWHYLPSGASYEVSLDRFDEKRLARDRGLQGDRELLLRQGLQRHVLQTMYVDRLLGDLLDVLDASPWGENAFLVVTADHGMAFRHEEPGRRVRADNHAEILSIPLFLRAPGEAGGRVVEGPVETVDILPTLLSGLGVEAADEVDGTSAFEAATSRSAHHFVEDAQPRRRRIEFDHAELLRARAEAVAHKAAIVGEGRDPWDPYRIGPYPQLVGTETPRAALEAACPVSVEAETGALAAAPAAGVVRALPAMAQARVGGRSAPLTFAVALNGRIAAVTRSFLDGNGNHRAAALLPDFLFRSGRNEIEWLWIEDGAPAEDPKLSRCAAAGDGADGGGR